MQRHEGEGDIRSVRTLGHSAVRLRRFRFDHPNIGAFGTLKIMQNQIPRDFGAGRTVPDHRLAALLAHRRFQPSGGAVELFDHVLNVDRMGG